MPWNLPPGATQRDLDEASPDYQEDRETESPWFSPWFRNYYECPECEANWASEWSATCDDTCPACGCRNVSPYQSEDA